MDLEKNITWRNLLFSTIVLLFCFQIMDYKWAQAYQTWLTTLSLQCHQVAEKLVEPWHMSRSYEYM